MVERVSAWSLRTRLIAIAAAALLAALVFGGLTMYWAATIEADQAMDARLEHLGATVLAFVEEEIEEEVAEIAAGKHTMPLQLKTRPSVSLLYRFQVWTRHGSLLMRNHEAPHDRPLMDLARLGYDTVHILGERYRAFALPTGNGEFIVQVAENIEERWTQTATITLYYVGFLALPLALVFGATWLWLRRSLRAIDMLAEQLGERRPADTTPVAVHDPPRELLPILRSLDSLFGRVAHALSVERAFTALAAHEMRTPLAGLRANAQMAHRARNPGERDEALQAVLTGADRAAHLVDQLLDLARVEAMPRDGGHEVDPVVLADVFGDVMHDLLARAEAKQITVSAHFAFAALRGHRFAIYVLLRNLIANAISYTPAGGRVEAHSAVDDDCAALWVDDSGPGIAAADRDRALERFNRLGRGISVEGVGLGLSIAQSVIELHHARLRLLDSPLGGLRVRIEFAADAVVQPSG